MLQITVEETQYFDEDTEEFITIPGQVLEFEHSLISVSKWESKHRKPFLVEGQHSAEEYMSYIQCMCMARNISPAMFNVLTSDQIAEAIAYIGQEQTATWINDVPGDNKAPSQQVVTSELIYYWMIAYGIPSDYQKWHLSRLLTLIRICEVKNKPQQKMSKAELHAKMRQLNAERRAKAGGRG